MAGRGGSRRWRRVRCRWCWRLSIPISRSRPSRPIRKSDAAEGESVASECRHRRRSTSALACGAPQTRRALRLKAEKCLATAIYFEARDEPVRAQIAVAQVAEPRSRRITSTTFAVSSIRTTIAISPASSLSLATANRRRSRSRSRGCVRRPSRATFSTVNCGCRTLPIDALSRRLGAPELDSRDEEDGQARRPDLLPAA